jgi:hypothetical protein
MIPLAEADQSYGDLWEVRLNMFVRFDLLLINFILVTISRIWWFWNVLALNTAKYYGFGSISTRSEDYNESSTNYQCQKMNCTKSQLHFLDKYYKGIVVLAGHGSRAVQAMSRLLSLGRYDRGF